MYIKNIDIQIHRKGRPTSLSDNIIFIPIESDSGNRTTIIRNYTDFIINLNSFNYYPSHRLCELLTKLGNYLIIAYRLGVNGLKTYKVRVFGNNEYTYIDEDVEILNNLPNITLNSDDIFSIDLEFDQNYQIQSGNYILISNPNPNMAKDCISFNIVNINPDIYNRLVVLPTNISLNDLAVKIENKLGYETIVNNNTITIISKLPLGKSHLTDIQGLNIKYNYKYTDIIKSSYFDQYKCIDIETIIPSSIPDIQVSFEKDILEYIYTIRISKLDKSGSIIYQESYKTDIRDIESIESRLVKFKFYNYDKSFQLPENITLFSHNINIEPSTQNIDFDLNSVERITYVLDSGNIGLQDTLINKFDKHNPLFLFTYKDNVNLITNKNYISYFYGYIDDDIPSYYILLEKLSKNQIYEYIDGNYKLPETFTDYNDNKKYISRTIKDKNILEINGAFSTNGVVDLIDIIHILKLDTLLKTAPDKETMLELPNRYNYIKSLKIIQDIIKDDERLLIIDSIIRTHYNKYVNLSILLTD